ncbi:DNA-binding protein [Roseibium album]|uniref:DNA-binding protein n=1 Tax=Roseibium album TaxID=311410 RepID=UPI002492ED3B|nr:DNA-binding protein [Roseibium album]
MSGNLDLTVTIAAADWAYSQRRLKYLETLLMRVVRDRKGLQEWFTAAELAGMVLPGMPTTPQAVSRKANKEGWRQRKTKQRGALAKAYHVSTLPARSFDALVSRILDLPPIDEVVELLSDLPDAAPDIPEPKEPENTAPAWVLPLMRIMRTETAGDLGEAWSRLPDRLPPGIALPTVDEAAEVLVELGLAGAN